MKRKEPTTHSASNYSSQFKRQKTDNNTSSSTTDKKRPSFLTQNKNDTFESMQQKKTAASQEEESNQKQILKKKQVESKQEEETLPQEVEEEATSDNNTKILHPYLNYLKQWKEKDPKWKKKISMERKIFTCFEMTTTITPYYFKVFLEYIASIRGNARRRLFDMATFKYNALKQGVEKDAKDLKAIKLGKKSHEVSVTDEDLDKELVSNIKARRIRAVLHALVLSDMIHDTNLCELPSKDNNNNGKEEDDNEDEE